MRLAIITQVPHYRQDRKLYSYAPYVREIDLWNAKAQEILLVAPLEDTPPGSIDLPYAHGKVVLYRVPLVNLLGIKALLRTFLLLPKVCFTIGMAMYRADHIHLRCPGNMGLLGCLIQILFPGKPKTAKYAGNWDPSAKQPWSYKLQRRILSNTFLTRNMQVLVYGNWPDQSKNIKPFFTATYREDDQAETPPRQGFGRIRLVFVGALAAGKRPEYALELFHQLQIRGLDVQLDFYGEGPMRMVLESQLAQNRLQNVTLHGNQPEPVIRAAYQNAHFLVLASQSEGWPKVVAEAMFWGCVPLATRVSCVADMMGQGLRGVLLDLNANQDALQISNLIAHPEKYHTMAQEGLRWSRRYTLDFFEREIHKLLEV